MENGVSLKQHRIRVVDPWNNVTNYKPLGKYPDTKMHWTPIPCQHCGSPPCVEECPTGAMIKRASDGIVVIDAEKCIACGFCVEACPYNAIALDHTTGVVDKCTMCHHRVDDGMAPFCVTICPSRAISFGNLSDKNSLVNVLLKSRAHQVMNPEFETMPSVYYLSP
jgi:molybdopterin-containing oxidoreductase family iron-sulfur binding subunit/tetrathionate reductase subunit B